MIRTIVNKTAVFLEMIKFEHSIFALPFAYLGFFLAGEGQMQLAAFIKVTVAMVSFRTMGMALNRLIDRQIDQANPRTQNRALPAGKLSSSFVWLITAFSFLIFEITCFSLNPMCLKLSPIPVFFAYLYPWTKRFTWFSHFVLGIILGIAPYGAWLANGGSFSWTPGWISLGIVAWVSGFDMIYALQDLEFDRQKGLFSFPARFGYQATLYASRILHLITVACWILAGLDAHLGWIYFAGLILISLFLLREHWLVHSFGLEKIQEAFFAMNAVVSVAIFVTALADVYLRRIHL